MRIEGVLNASGQVSDRAREGGTLNGGAPWSELTKPGSFGISDGPSDVISRLIEEINNAAKASGGRWGSSGNSFNEGVYGSCFGRVEAPPNRMALSQSSRETIQSGPYVLMSLSLKAFDFADFLFA